MGTYSDRDTFLTNILCKEVLPVLEASNMFQWENIADQDGESCPVIRTLQKRHSFSSLI